MKIAVFNDWWYPEQAGGTEVSALKIFQMMNKHHQISIYTLQSKSQHKSNPKTNLHVVRTLILRKSYKTSRIVKILDQLRIIIDLISPYLVVRKIAKFKPDYVIVHNISRIGPYIFFFCSKFLPNAKMIRIYHDLSDTCLTRKRFRNSSICKKTCLPCKPKQTINLKLQNRYVSCGISNSKFTLSKLRSLGLTINQMTYAYPTENGSPKRLEKESMIESGPRTLGLGFVGRISNEKGIYFLIEALSKINFENRLIIVGSAPSDFEKIKVLQYAKKRNVKVEMTGYLKKPYEFLKSTVSAVVVPSLYEEPFGKVPLEAISHGLPVLLAKNGGLAEISDFFEPSLPSFSTDSTDELCYLISKRAWEINVVMKTEIPFMWDEIELVMDNEKRELY